MKSESHAIILLKLHPEHGAGAVDLVQGLDLLVHLLQLLNRVDPEPQHIPTALYNSKFHLTTKEMWKWFAPETLILYANKPSPD